MKEQCYIDQLMEDPVKVAEARGQIADYPADDECQLDLDSKDALIEFYSRLRFLEEFIPEVDVLELPSKSQGHYHIIITFSEDISMWQRLAMQSILGSDHKREILNCARALNGDENPTILFRPKEEASEKD